MSIAKTAVRLKVTLDRIEPEVMRRLVVPLTIRLDRLHLTLQAAFGWTNTHLYAFTANGVSWGIPDPHFPMGDQPVDARKARLYDIVRDTGAKTRPRMSVVRKAMLRFWRRSPTLLIPAMPKRWKLLRQASIRRSSIRPTWNARSTRSRRNGGRSRRASDPPSRLTFRASRHRLPYCCLIALCSCRYLLIYAGASPATVAFRSDRPICPMPPTSERHLESGHSGDDLRRFHDMCIRQDCSRRKKLHCKAARSRVQGGLAAAFTSQ